MSRLCVGANPIVLHHFQEGSKARKKSRSAMFGVVSCLKDKFLEDTIQEIGFGNEFGNGAYACGISQTMIPM